MTQPELMAVSRSVSLEEERPDWSEAFMTGTMGD